MSLTNEEWIKLFEKFIEEVQPDKTVKVSIDKKRPTVVRFLLSGVRGITTSILVAKTSVIGESERQIRQTIVTNLAAIGVKGTLPKEDEPVAVRDTPNEDGGMSPGEAARMRAMINNSNPLEGIQATGHQVVEGNLKDDEVALTSEHEDLLEQLGEEAV